MSDAIEELAEEIADRIRDRWESAGLYLRASEIKKILRASSLRNAVLEEASQHVLLLVGHIDHDTAEDAADAIRALRSESTPATLSVDDPETWIDRAKVALVEIEANDTEPEKTGLDASSRNFMIRGDESSAPVAGEPDPNLTGWNAGINEVYFGLPRLLPHSLSDEDIDRILVWLQSLMKAEPSDASPAPSDTAPPDTDTVDVTAPYTMNANAPHGNETLIALDRISCQLHELAKGLLAPRLYTCEHGRGFSEYCEGCGRNAPRPTTAEVGK